MAYALFDTISSPNTTTYEISADKQLSWDIPTLHTDGTPIPDGKITGYKIYKDGVNWAVCSTWSGNQTGLSHPCWLDVVDENALLVGPSETYTTLQAALDVVQPGQTIYIRGGTYQQQASDPNIWNITKTAGTSGNPITIASYPGETAILSGRAGLTPMPNDGSIPPNASTTLQIDHDYYDVKNITMNNATKYAVRVEDGSFINLSFLTINNIWLNGILVASANAISDVTVEFCDVSNCLHHSGILVGPSSSATSTSTHNNMTVRFNLSYNNGYMLNGDQVVPVGGDPAGGGNSDSGGTFKEAHDKALPGENLMSNCWFYGNIGWNNSDDIFDHSAGNNTTLSREIALRSGPEGKRGYKMLRAVEGGFRYWGCVAATLQAQGYEFRYGSTNIEVYGCTAVDATNEGFKFVKNDTAGVNFFNVLSTTNVSNDTLTASGTVLTPTTSHLNDAGAAGILGSTDMDTLNYTLPAGNFWTRYRFIYDQVSRRISPVKDGNLYRTGTFVADKYSATAIDNATTPSDPLSSQIPWTTGGVDIGALPYQEILPPIVKTQAIGGRSVNNVDSNFTRPLYSIRRSSPRRGGRSSRFMHIFPDGRDVIMGPYFSLDEADEIQKMVDNHPRAGEVIESRDAFDAFRLRLKRAYRLAPRRLVERVWLNFARSHQETREAYFFFSEIMPQILSYGLSDIDYERRYRLGVGEFTKIRLRWQHMAFNSTAIETYQSVAEADQ